MATFLIGILLVFSLYFFVICPIKQGLQKPYHTHEDNFDVAKTLFEEIGISESEIRKIYNCSGNFANQVMLVEFHNGLSAVFKPSDGERKLRSGTKVGSYYRRERAAYFIDRFLGLGMVPPTTIRDVNGKTGSLQLFIDGAKEGINLRFDKREEKIFKEQLIAMWIFDYLIYNTDRHNSNWLFLGGKIFAIDNGLSFAENPIFTASYNEYYEEDLPSSLIIKLEKRFCDKKGREILKELLQKLLSDEEISAFFSRLDYIGNLASEHKKIPRWARDEFEKFKH